MTRSLRLDDEEVPGSTPRSEAPWYHVPPRALTSIEHPYLVKNIDKAIDMCDREEAVAEAAGD